LLRFRFQELGAGFFLAATLGDVDPLLPAVRLHVVYVGVA
jgi:hypothetical protein